MFPILPTNVEPLPHRITARSEAMLPRPPLPFLVMTATPHNGKAVPR